MIRLATPNDITYVRDMCIKFLKFSPYGNLPYDIHKIEDSFYSLIEDKNISIVLLSTDTYDIPKGMLAIKLGGLPFSGATVAHEVVWWMEEEDRKTRQAIEMFKAAEYWAQKVGAAYMQFSSLSVSDEGVDRFYTRQGYTMTEKAFLKEIR